MRSNNQYIERENVLEMLKQECSPMVFAYLADLVNDIPAADVRPVALGKWVEMFDHDEYPARNHWFCCSVCGHIAPFGRMSDTELHTNFCPNCGADMREEGHA